MSPADGDPPDVPAASGAPDAQERWHLLLDAVVSMVSDLSLDDLLKRIVEIAAELARARYAALGVCEAGGDQRLGAFVARGRSEDDASHDVDRPPEVLLELLGDWSELRRPTDAVARPGPGDVSDGQPPTGAVLEVPVRIQDQVFGNLYLAEKADGTEFTEEDEEIVTALAAAAGVVLQNARLYEDAERRERWLAATAELTAVLLRPESDELALQIVADRARELAYADVAWVVAGPDEAHLQIKVVSGRTADPDVMAGIDLSNSLARGVVANGRSVTVEDLSADPRALDVALRLGWEPLGSAVMVPLASSSGVEGVVALAWSRDSDRKVESVDPALPGRFAEQAALALQVARARRDEQRLALLEDRDRIARDLHDLVIQRLFATGLGLATTPLRDPVEAAERIEQAVDDLDATIRDIRRTIFALGSMSESADIRTAVGDVVDRAVASFPVRPRVRFHGPVASRIGQDLAPDVLAVLNEALSNAARHAQASTCTVELNVEEGVRLRVTDDGRGMPDRVAESGLANMRHRAEQWGGRLTITSTLGEGTEVEWWVPG